MTPKSGSWRAVFDDAHRSLSQDWDQVTAETAYLCSPRLESQWGGPQGLSWLNSGGPCCSKTCSLTRLTLRLGQLEGKDARTSLCDLASFEPGSLQAPRTSVTASKAKVAFSPLPWKSQSVSFTQLCWSKQSQASRFSRGSVDPTSRGHPEEDHSEWRCCGAVFGKHICPIPPRVLPSMLRHPALHGPPLEGKFCGARACLSH